MLKKFIKDESGQGLAEYALILALIAIVVIVSLKGIGDAADAKLDSVADEISTAGTPDP